ncbi:MAG: TMEM165/GDT1 family protein [Patescibacteria group bacterium]|nr:TMEM165/GDT1 family protein [Patescibacteria group bacterium]
MDFGIIALVFGVIFIAELPDKSLFAALVLGSKYPGKHVWLGACAAFFVHVVIAVTAGQLLTLLPHKVTEAVVAVLFLLGAALIFFGKHGIESQEVHAKKPNTPDVHSPLRIFITSFSVVFVGELGDITQIATANYAAKYHNALSVGIGATVALWSVSALAIFAGSKAFSIVSPKILQRVTGTVLLGFGLYTLFGLLR